MDAYETNSDRIKPLIEEGIAQLIDAKSCEKFNEYLCAEYPWVGYSDRIDWEKVSKPYQRLSWQEADVEQTTNFLKATCMNRFNEVCIVYGAMQPGLVVNFDYACRELENLAIFGWATRFMVGVKRNNYGIVDLVHECFVEIDFADWLTVPLLK